MKIQDLFLIERVVNIFSAEDKEKIYDEIRKMLEITYEKVPGGLGDINHISLITAPGIWKIIKRNKSITAGVLYRDHFGRKIRLVFYNNTQDGKKDLIKILFDDSTLNRSWVECSDPLESCLLKLGIAKIPASKAEELLDTKIDKIHADGYHYDRTINGKSGTKILLGTLK
jgi:hypothetical protein